MLFSFIPPSFPRHIIHSNVCEKNKNIPLPIDNLYSDMAYQREILLILREANHEKGLPIDTIVRHVYNMTAVDLFSSRPYEDVKADVAKFLKTESSYSQGAVCKCEKRGWYRLNTASQIVTQLMLEFEIDENDEWMM